MNDNGKVKEKLLGDTQDDPEANNDDEKKKEEEKEKKEEQKEKRSVWRDFIDIDFYDLFKQLSPIIPTLPSVYAIIISMFRDHSSSSIANWYKVLDFIENLNICLYSISATIFYKIFKKKKKNKDKVRIKLALNVERLNKLFLVYCFLISGAKLVLGIILPVVDDVPDDQTIGLFIFSLFAKVGLILAQLFYLYTVYVKKYYKALPILEDAADDGFVNESTKKNEDEGDDDIDEKGKDKLKNIKKKMKEREKKKKKPGEEKNQEEMIKALKKENEESAKKNERLMGVVENLSEANKNWSDLKEEFSALKKLNFILLKFAKPLLEVIELKISNQMDGGKSSLVAVKVTDEVQDVKRRIRSQLTLPVNTTKLVLKTNQEEELEDDDFIGKYNLEEGLKLTYS